MVIAAAEHAHRPSSQKWTHADSGLIRARLRPGPSTYFSQWLQPGLHDELVLAELAAARVGALDPLLQAGLVHEVQAPRAVAGRDQRALVVPLTVADPRAQEGEPGITSGADTGCQGHSPKKTLRNKHHRINYKHRYRQTRARTMTAN